MKARIGPKKCIKKNWRIILSSVFTFNLIGSEVFLIFKFLFFQINTKRTNSPKKNFWVNFIQTKISNIFQIIL